MKYLTGSTNDRDEPSLIAAGIGLMVQPNNSYYKRIDRYPMWAADNGAFADTWSEDKWALWLDMLPREDCLFAVAPDVYPDAEATLARSEQYFDLIRDMGFPVAFVAQDGAEDLDLPWPDFDCLFIGGARNPNPAKEWKTGPGAERLCRDARNKGKWVHMGRVNSRARMQRARDMGCNSADGTFIKYRLRHRAADKHGERDLRGAGELAGWMEWLDQNPSLFDHFELPALPVHRKALQ